mgnify:CR=1 FL=1
MYKFANLKKSSQAISGFLKYHSESVDFCKKVRDIHISLRALNM